MEEKKVIVTDTHGLKKIIPESKIPLALQTYKELENIAIQAGMTQDEAKEWFTLTILPVKE